MQTKGISVYHARLSMGEQLAEVIKEKMKIEDIDVIIPVRPIPILFF